MKIAEIETQRRVQNLVKCEANRARIDSKEATQRQPEEQPDVLGVTLRAYAKLRGDHEILLLQYQARESYVATLEHRVELLGGHE